LALNKQIHLYGVGTDYFYNKKEEKINIKLNKLRITKKNWVEKIIIIKNLSKRARAKLSEEDIENIELNNEIYRARVSELNQIIKIYKNKLINKLDNNKKRRKMNTKKIKKSDIISSFDSTTTRVTGCEIGEVTEDIIVIQTYYFQIAESIWERGFTWNGEEYIAYTASAGQIRLKKFVAIKKSVYDKHKLTLTCGLTEDIINERGGVNTNKYLAYLALNNSATDVWEDFNIDNAIVVDDFETNVKGLVDFIDYETYKIESKKEMKIPIPHTDGIGIYLSDKNRMVRLPWIKGLMTPFPYIRFINKFLKQYPNARYVKDIYGKEYDIIEDGITAIFTKSQFKMWKYYDSWDQYKENYKLYNCHASYCNEEVKNPPTAKINYQMLQTLTDVNDSEIDSMVEPTVKKITNMGEDVGVMLKVLKADNNYHRKNSYQEALNLYPELLQDPHSREVLKAIKKSLVKDARGGKLYIDGKYTFICPDIYAFAEWLFLDIEHPNGLLSGNQVSCKLYKRAKKLDVLRSPSLYREHFIGENTFNTEINKWLPTNAIYMSSHCLASLLLMYDVDGDQSLVCAEPTITKVAERNMVDIVPLYYNMKKAPSQQLNNKTIYEGLSLAYRNTSIGLYSNNITKVWNSDDPNLDVVKLLCLESNFSIDSAKTLFFIERPENENNLISRYTKSKVPHFFMYAKDKPESNVEPINTDSIMGKIEGKIPSDRLTFKRNNLPTFDYTMLMKNKGIKLDDEITQVYKELNIKVGHYSNRSSDDDNSHMYYIYNEVRDTLLDMRDDKHEVVDVLVAYTFGNKAKYKNTLWSCFGDIILQNLKVNMIKKGLDKTICCNRCGERVVKKAHNQLYCDRCKEKIQLELQRKSMNKHRKSLIL